MDTMNYVNGGEMGYGTYEPYPYTSLLGNCGGYQEAEDMNNNHDATYGSNCSSDFSDNADYNCDDFDEYDDGDCLAGYEGDEDGAKISKAAKLDRVKRIVDNNGRKRRIYSTIHKDPKQSTRRFRANDRERRRMNSLNGALQALKGCVPSYHGKKRLTKLQILKFACHYISDLSDILCSSEDCGEKDSKPQMMNYHPELNHSNTTNELSSVSQGTNFDNIDAFVNIMAAEQQKNIMDPAGHQMQGIPTDHDNNVNGLSMLQRLEYLTFHSYMAAMTEGNDNLNLSGVSDSSSNSDFFPINLNEQTSGISPNNNNNHIYNY